MARRRIGSFPVRFGLIGFLRTRYIVSGTVTLVLVGLLTLLFGSVQLEFLELTPSAYGSAVVYTVSPVLASVAALGVLRSRLDQWERNASRSLWWMRAALCVAVIVAATLSLLPASLTEPVPEASRAAVQGVAACMGLGLMLSPIVAYEAQVLVVVAYGLVGVLVTPSSSAAGWALLVGGDPADHRTVFALGALAAGVVTYTLWPPRHSDGD